MDTKIDLGTVHYEQIGEGRPIFILHGAPGDVTFMRGMMEPVFNQRPDWQRTYLDLPGFGMTEANRKVDSYDRVLDFVVEAIETISGGEPYALAGYSYGGYLAQGMVRTNPDELRGLCLIAPRVVQDSKLKSVPEKRVLYEELGFSDQLEEGQEWMADYLVVQEKYRLERFLKYTLPCIENMDVEFMERLEKSGSGLSFDVTTLDRSFEYPTLIVTGRQDNVIGYRDAWSTLEAYPRATFAVLDRAGHFLGLAEQRDLFSTLVCDWLDRVGEATW
jgi:pimeloyl-ACP methyl ester carboxylesterase